MSQHFYRDIQLAAKFCRAPGCGVEYRPPKDSFFAMLGYCYPCRRKYYVRWYKEHQKPYLKRMTPDQMREYKRKQYKAWIAWVAENLGRRRQQALASYHKNKGKHKGRKHRATKKEATA